MIKDYLVLENEKLLRVQAMIPKHLAVELKRYMEKNNITWNRLINASLEALGDEIKGKKK